MTSVVTHGVLTVYFFNFLGTAEKLAIREYSASIGKSKDIMEHYISLLAEQGITHVPIWQPELDAAKVSIERTDNDESNLVINILFSD